jgi:hypothetical protein
MSEYLYVEKPLLDQVPDAIRTDERPSVGGSVYTKRLLIA